MNDFFLQKEIVKIDTLEVFHFSFPFVKGLRLKTRMFQSRQGLIIRLATGDEDEGWGEISPLPGFSRESLEEAQAQVLSFKSKILNQTIPSHCERFDGSLERWMGPHHLFSSVRFGMESAVLNLLAEMRGIPLHRLLGTPRKIPVPLIGLLEGSFEVITKETLRLLQKGVRTFKLKVGRDIADDLHKIEKIKKLVGPGTLRLDANQSWSFKEAVEFARVLPQGGIEYIEEPFKNPSPDKVSDFYRETEIPVALDESLMKMKPEELAPIGGLKAVILKPTLLGGIERTMRFIKQARKLGIDSVVSSSFESGVGLWTLAHLALVNGDVPAGLDTQKWFQKDLIQDPLRIKLKAGRLHISPEPLKKEDLNLNLLTKVSL